MSVKQEYNGPILEINNLSISFFTRLREIPAVMDFSCVVQPGEAMGLVGKVRVREINGRTRGNAGFGRERPDCWRLYQV